MTGVIRLKLLEHGEPPSFVSPQTPATLDMGNPLFSPPPHGDKRKENGQNKPPKA